MTIPLMIDSGAYSAWTRGETIDIDDYADFVLSIQQSHTDMICVNLDVIEDGKASYKNWIYLKEKGVTTLPVYHIGTEEKWLRRYLQKTDHIGLGAIAKVHTSQRVMSLDRIWGDYLVEKNGMPKCKVHGMGVTGFSLIQRYPWHSVDSTSWLQMGIYGKVYIPFRRRGKWRYDEPPFVLAFSENSPTTKEKGAHITNLSPRERENLMEYLDFTGVPYGKSEGGEVEEKGVSNDFNSRCHLNALFFGRFMGNMEWPRKFLPKRVKGLFS